jgi:hypothetical protein
VMVAGDDMIDFKRCPRPNLRQATVLAPPIRPSPHQPLQRGVHASLVS